MSFFENTRKPVGLGGKIMVVMMNLGHSPVARWGLQFLNAAPDAKVLDCGCGGGANMKRLLKKCPQEIEFFNSFVDKGLKERLTHVMTSDFGRVSYTEAVEILKQHNDQFDFKVDWGTDLQTEHERFLTEQVFKRPVFVTDYPAEIKAFYMRMNDDGKTVAAADCLVPGIGEIIGGSQREERLEVLEERIRQLGMNPEDYWWYCDLRRYGSCKHAGFGLGFERMVMYLTGVSNIRDVELHPRTVGNAEF